jgi:hypothetical protein
VKHTYDSFGYAFDFKKMRYRYDSPYDTISILSLNKKWYKMHVDSRGLLCDSDTDMLDFSRPVQDAYQAYVDKCLEKVLLRR